MGDGLLAFVREDAYFKIFKAFAAGKHDLTKELLLSRLRKEFDITDARHSSLRQRVMDGQPLQQREYAEEAAPAKKNNRHNKARQPKRERVQTPEISDDDDEADYIATKAANSRPVQLSNRPSRPTKRIRQDNTNELENRVESLGGVEINRLIGYKVQRYWPEYGGWWEGVITDFKNGEHCIVYDMNTPKESYEWYDISIARSDEFRVSKERINIMEHAKKAPPPANLSTPARRAAGPSALASGGGRNHGRSHFSHNAKQKSRPGLVNGHAIERVEGNPRNGTAPASPFVAESDSESTTSDSDLSG